MSLHQLGNQALQQRIIERLHGTSPPSDLDPFQIAGLSPDQFSLVEHLVPQERTPAAVLMPLIVRPDGITALFTQRASHLRKHAGQISFPGGRIEPGDVNALAAALRETEEEIGLSRNYVQLLGYLPAHLVFTGFRIVPVVALVQPGFVLTLDTREVAEVFEVPLSYLLNPENHQAREREIGTVTARVYDIPYGERRIWGATAGIIMTLYRLLLETA